MTAAGTVVKTKQRLYDGEQITLAWTADASGNVTDGGTDGAGTFSGNGYFVGQEYEPGTAAANYDVTLVDNDVNGAIDVLRGTGANLPHSAGNTYDTKYRSNMRDVDGAWMFFFNKPLTLNVSGAGNGGTGTARFKFSRAENAR